MLLTDELTDREKEVLQMLGKGHTAESIALEYEVNITTSRRWLQEIRAKLNANTDTQAVVMALTAGLIE